MSGLARYLNFTRQLTKELIMFFLPRWYFQLEVWLSLTAGQWHLLCRTHAFILPSPSEAGVRGASTVVHCNDPADPGTQNSQFATTISCKGSFFVVGRFSHEASTGSTLHVVGLRSSMLPEGREGMFTHCRVSLAWGELPFQCKWLLGYKCSYFWAVIK